MRTHPRTTALSTTAPRTTAITLSQLPRSFALAVALTCSLALSLTLALSFTATPAQAAPQNSAPDPVSNGMNADQCIAAKLVWVVLERDTGAQQGACATKFATGLEALESSGFGYTFRPTQPGFVATIGGYPTNPGGTMFWSYWSAPAPAKPGATPAWEFSDVGAGSSSPQPGSIQGWHYVDWTKGFATPPAWYPGAAPKQASAATGMLGDHTGDRIADIYGVDVAGKLRIWRGSSNGPLIELGRVNTGFDQFSYLGQINDITGDRRSDLLARKRVDNSLWLYRGTGAGYVAPVGQVGQNWGGMDQIVPAYNLAGGATQYVVARRSSDGSLFRYNITSTGLTHTRQIGQNWGGMRQFVGIGDITGDGRADVLGLRADGTLWAYQGRSDGTIADGRQVGHGWSGFRLAFSPGDLTGDGRYDLVGVRGDGVVFVYENKGGGFGAARQVLTQASGLTLMA